MSNSQITTNDEKTFLAILFGLGFHKAKLLFGAPDGNGFEASHEIRWMPTPGGMKFCIAEFDYMNRRGSGIYSDEVDDTYLRAIDIEKTSKQKGWWLTKDCEHVPSSEYRDVTDHLPANGFRGR